MVPSIRTRLASEGALVLAFVALITFYLGFEGGAYDLVLRQTVGLLVWTALAVGLILGWLPRARPSRALLVPGIAALGLVAWMALSLTWTESAERTTVELTRLLDYAGLAALVLCTIERRTFAAAAAGLSVGAFAITAVAISSRLFPDLFPDAGEVARLFSRDRLDFPLDYWNAVGAWAAMSAAAGLAWSAHVKAPALRALALGLVPLAGACAYLTYSRGAAVGVIVAGIATVALSRNRWTALVHAIVAGAATVPPILAIGSHQEIADATGNEGAATVVAAILLGGAICAAVAAATGLAGLDRLRLPRRTAIRATVGGAVVALLLTATFAGGPIEDAWHEFTSDETVTTGAERLTSAGGNRHNLWASAFEAFDAHPLEGTGPGTYEFWWSRDARHPEYVRNAHSLYLESLAETGAPGFLLLVAMLAGGLGAALAVRRLLDDPAALAASVAMCAMFCVFLVNAGVDWMWQSTAIAAMALAAIAIAAAGGSGLLDRAQRRRPLGRPGVRALLVGVCVAAAVAQVPGLVSTERVRDSQEAAREGDLAASQRLAEEAVDAMPWASTPYEQLALVEEETGELAAAERDMQTAVDNEPTNWRYPLALSRIQAARGERAAAQQTFESGRRLRPLSPAYSPYSAYGRAVYNEAELLEIWRQSRRRDR